MNWLAGLKSLALAGSPASPQPEFVGELQAMAVLQGVK